MKNVMIKLTIVSALIASLQVDLQAQDSMRNVNRPTTSKDSATYSDTSFVNRSVRQLIVEYKLAEMAQQNAERPKIKAVARDIMGNNREALRRLLEANGNKPIAGVNQKDLDNIRKATLSQQTGEGDRSAQGGRRTRGITGNTATDSLGSGKTGSGNVEGEDTSTLAASRPDDRQENYSEQGDYLYDSESFEADLEIASNSRGKQFEQRWLEMMYKLQHTKIIRYNKAADITKDQKLRSAALAALPVAKLDLETVRRLMRDAGPAESTDPTQPRRMGDDNNNRKNAKTGD
jgi:uncharacterized protein (DUF305 family)